MTRALSLVGLETIVRLDYALIVDETRERSETLRRLLEENTPRVRTVRDPDWAWEGVRNERPDAVFLHARFRAPARAELIGRIREYAPACAVVVTGESLDATMVSE